MSEGESGKERQLDLWYYKPRSFVSKWFQDFWKPYSDAIWPELTEEIKTRTPLINIKEEEDHYEILAELPGLDREDIDLTLSEDFLEIRGRREEEKKEDNNKYVRREYSSSSYFRRFKIPENIEMEDIEAQAKKGVLIIKLPKSEEVQPESKKVEIK